MHLALGDQARDLAAALEARIDKSLKPRERRAVIVEMRALAAHGLLPCDAEPRQVFIDRRFVLRPAARRVDILDAQQEPAAGRARHLEIDERRERMADMQIAVRARREAEDGSAHARAGRPCPRKGLRRDGICRCFAAVMSFFIHTEADLDHAIARLVDADPRFGIVLSRAGRPPLRRRPDGFSGLASIVVSQQLSTASAKAIWARLNQAFDPFDHAAVLRARSPRLARAGLSAQKPSIAGSSIFPRWSRSRRTRLMPCSRRFMASGPGPPTSIFCSASATPTPGPPAISLCRRRRGYCSRSRRARPRKRWGRWPNRGAHGAARRPACSGPTTARPSSGTARRSRRR